MRKFFNTLSDAQLKRIADDYSIGGTREEMVDALCEYFKGYGYKPGDLIARYQLRKEDV